MILAGDIGGTKARLGLFEQGSPEPLVTVTYRTRDFESLADIIATFLAATHARPTHAAFGVAGVVVGRRVPRIGLPWDLDAAELERRLGFHRVTLVNDVEASARGIGALGNDDLAVLHAGAPDAFGTRAVVSAGTGLGEAAIWWDGVCHRPAASEGGSCSFGPSSPLQVELYRFLAAERGHVSWGYVCSGPGLRNLYRFLSGAPEAPEPAEIAAAADADRTSVASAAVDLFCSLYGARAGDVALAYGATGGVYLGGGIAPKLLPRLLEGSFVRAFLSKGGLTPFVRRVPVHVVLSADAPVIGAALYAWDSAQIQRLAA